MKALSLVEDPFHPANENGTAVAPFLASIILSRMASTEDVPSDFASVQIRFGNLRAASGSFFHKTLIGK